MSSRLKTLIPILSSILFSWGCGSAKEVDKIGDAQQCLNNSTATTAMDCVSKVDGLTSTGAYNIRCAAAFIREGFTNPSKYTNAFSSLNGSGGTANFMGLVSFSSVGSINADTTNASATFSDCLAASAKGKTLISAFGYFSTALMKFFADASGANECKAPVNGLYNLNTCITAAEAAAAADAIANPTNPTIALSIASLADVNTSASSAAGIVQTSIGSVVISTYNISCAGKGANESLCNTLSTAITSGGGQSNPRSVFVSFFTTSVKPN